MNVARKLNLPIVVCTNTHVTQPQTAYVEPQGMNYSLDQLNFFFFLELGVMLGISLHLKPCLFWGREHRYQCNARFLCLDWEFSRREAPRGEESSVLFIICASNARGAVFAGTGVNWEPHFTNHAPGTCPAEHWITLQRIISIIF